MAKVPPRQAFRQLVLRTLSGVTQANFPGFIEPMHPTQHAKPPAGARWQYEIKLDGWRGQLHLRNRTARMFSRNGNDLTAQCGTITAAAAELQANSVVMDGEIVVPGENGIPNFLALRSAMFGGQSKLLYYAFDLLHLDGYDLRGASLADRRGVLAQLLAGRPGGRLLVSETIDIQEPPDVLYRHACELGMEGIVPSERTRPIAPGACKAGSR